jgi:four helix bundle protein
MRDDDPEYREWLETVPLSITADLIWKLPAYRLGLFLSGRVAADVALVQANPTTRAAADQLFRAVGSIPANIAEGYGRSSGRERARYFEFALGSAREAREWYFATQSAFPDAVIANRMSALNRIARILAAVIPRERIRTYRPATPG